MDIFSLLSYINKVSLLAFFVTTLVVGYQIYALKKERTKEQAPTIPDFKEKKNFNEAVNFTSLPSSLTKKELKKADYSKLVFLIISLLTIMVVIFVVFLIKQNSSVRNEASISQTTPTLKPTCTGQACLTPTVSPIIVKPTVILSATPVPTVTPIIKPTMALSPSPIVSLSLSPTMALSPSSIVSLSPSPIISLSPSPTEIFLAKASTCTGQACLSPTETSSTGGNSKTPQTLPETGNVGKGLLIFGVAISTIFFSFWF